MSFDRAHLAMLVHQTCTSVLLDDFLCTPVVRCLRICLHCGKVTTFPAEKTRSQTWVRYWKLIGTGEWAIIAHTGFPLLPRKASAKTRAEQCRMPGEYLRGAESRHPRSVCSALMRLMKSQCSVVYRNRPTLENGSVVRALLPANLPSRLPLTVHRLPFANRQRPSRGFTLGS